MQQSHRCVYLGRGTLDQDVITIDVFYDYACPYVHAAAVWLRSVQQYLGDRLVVRWRYFPLEQVNAADGPDWKLWDQPAEFKSRGRDAFHAAIAARQQGEEAFNRFHYALLDLKHVHGKDHGKRSTHLEAARLAALDMERFLRDLEDRSLLAAIERDYVEGRERHGVFGTPTIVFPDGAAAYLKMRPAAPPEEAVRVFEDFVRTVRDRSYVIEIKRPKRSE